MKNYFQASKTYPYHISVGAVVVNGSGEVCCHYFKKFEHPSFGVGEDFYILMRETIEPNETIERCLARGLREEFGMEAKLIAYLGAIISHFPLIKDGSVAEKATLYFLCEPVSFDVLKRDPADEEASSVIRWVKPEELIPKMKEQSKRLGRIDTDESAILQRLVDLRRHE